MATSADRLPGQVKARTSRLAILTLIAIVVVAAGLRFWNIGAGIPHNVGADEPHVMERVERMMKTGDFNPHFFDWPTLTFYLNLVVAVFAFLKGAMSGAWSHLDQMKLEHMYLTGRQFTAVVGTATVALTFLAGRRWSVTVGLIAAAFMALMPGHIRESRYVLADVPAAFFTTLAWVLAMRAMELRTTRAIVWSGLTVGLAASCKYNGLMAVVFPFIAVVQIGGGWRLVTQRLGLVLALIVAGFLAGTPYAVLDLPTFLNDYARVAMNFARVRTAEPGWSVYLKHFTYGVGWPAAIAVAIGLLTVAVRAVRRPNERAVNLMLLSFVAVYFYVMATKGQIYARYLLPLFPAVSVAGGVLVATVMEWIGTKWPERNVAPIAAAVLVLTIIGGPAVKAVQFLDSMTVRSTIAEAYDWIVGNVPPGSKVAIEYGAMTLPSRYPTIGVKLLSQRSAEYYRNEGVQYLVAAVPDFQAFLTNPSANPEMADRYRELVAAAREIASFSPSDTVTGPQIRVYRLDW